MSEKNEKMEMLIVEEKAEAIIYDSKSYTHIALSPERKQFSTFNKGKKKQKKPVT